MFDRDGRDGRNGRARTAALAALVLCAWSGCSLHQEGVHPPDNRIFFPGGAVIESGGEGLGRWLYVVNSNSDLRYNSGTIAAVNLDRVREDYLLKPARGLDGAWRDCPRDTRRVPAANIGELDQCCWDFIDPTILNCDEQKYINRNSTVRIGSFGGRPVMQQLPSSSGGAAGRRRMFVPVRGDSAIGMVDVSATPDDVRFLCTGSRSRPDEAQAKFAVCDARWRISREDDPLSMPGTPDLPDDQIVRLPSEPYALAVDERLQLLYVGHLRGGSVSLIDLGVGEDTRTPELLQIYPGLLPPDANGFQGVTSLTIKNRNSTCFGPVYVASRYSPVIGSFVVYGLRGIDCQATRDLDDPQAKRGIAIVGTGQVMSTGLAGSETRGIEFISDGIAAEPERAFLLQRTPPALVAVDLATQAPFATIEVCQSPTNLIQQTDEAGRTVALFVTCFDGGEVYVIDPWLARLRTIIPVGRGPVATVLPPQGAPPEDSTRAYVVGFGANNIVVIDLDPASPTQYRAIQRIGFPSPTPREVGPQ